MNTALYGLQTAQTSFVKSAEKISNISSVLTTENESPVEQIEQPVPPIQGITGLNQGSTAFLANDISLIEESVNLISASHAYKANANIIKTFDEMTKSTISTLS